MVSILRTEYNKKYNKKYKKYKNVAIRYDDITT